MARFKEPDRSLPVRWRGALEGLLPDDHLARFIWSVLLSLDFSDLEQQFPSVRGGPGRSPYHPRLLAALWIYGMSQGLETAAGIAEAIRIREDFQWIAGGQHPCDQTLLNFITRTVGTLASIWIQVLQALHAAGLVDLSLIAEDGTKVRANASPRSFKTGQKITTVIGEIEKRLNARLQEVAERAGEETDRKATAEIAALRARLVRARQAETELKKRLERRQPSRPDDPTASLPPEQPTRLFGSDRFRHDPERDVLLCPAESELRFIGEYQNDKVQGRYRLYGRRSCSDCAIKIQCTAAAGRRVKIQIRPPEKAIPEGSVSRAPTEEKPSAAAKPDEPPEPTASLTEPEAAWMLATSRKRWEPSFNADIAVTRDGIIISQFLSADCTDYHHFAPTVDFVIAKLGKPEAWIADGHYGTVANIVLADRTGITLFAPRPGAQTDSEPAETAEATEANEARKKATPRRFSRENFQPHPDRKVMLCPANEELRYIGEYLNDNRTSSYQLFGRSNCTGCSLKLQCTAGQGRRLRMPGQTSAPADVSPRKRNPSSADSAAVGNDGLADGLDATNVAELVRCHNERMKLQGIELLKLRGCMSELVNAHLHQHGLGRFHVRGLPRCAVVLALACIAHNLGKWASREAVRLMRIAS
jgi:transposase